MSLRKRLGNRSTAIIVAALAAIGFMLISGVSVWAVGSIPYVYGAVNTAGQVRIVDGPDDIGQRDSLIVLATEAHIVELANRLASLQQVVAAQGSQISDLNGIVAALRSEVDELKQTATPVELWLSVVEPSGGNYTLVQRTEQVPITVRMLNQLGTPLPDGTLVEFQLGGDEIGSLSSTNAVTVGGLASVNYIGPAFACGGQDIISIETGFGPGPSVTITVPESVSRFINVTPNFTVSSSSEEHIISVTLLDSWGQPITWLGPVSFHLHDLFIPDPVGEVSPTSTITDGNGVATVTYTGPSDPPSQDRTVSILIQYGYSYFQINTEIEVTVLAWE